MAKTSNRQQIQAPRLPFPPLAEQPDYVEQRQQLTAVEQRIGQAEQRERVARARLRGQPPTSTPADRAAALLKGGKISVGAPADAELHAAHEELRLLTEARLAAHEALSAVLGELSAQVCQAMRPEMLAAQRDVVAALAQLHRAFEHVRTIRALIQGAGYQLLPHVLGTVHNAQAEGLGDPGRPDTIAGRYRTLVGGE